MATNDSTVQLSCALRLKLHTPGGELEVRLTRVGAQVLASGLLVATGSTDRKYLHLAEFAEVISCESIVAPVKAPTKTIKLGCPTVRLGRR